MPLAEPSLRLLQNIVNQKKQEEELAQQALDAGKPTKASGMPQPAAPAPVGEKRRNRWDQNAPAECVAVLHHITDLHGAQVLKGVVLQ